MGFRLFELLRDRGEHRIALTARCIPRATAERQVVLVIHPGMMRVDRSTKSDAQVHVDDIFAVGQKAMCEQFYRDLNQITFETLRELRWYSLCFFRKGLREGCVDDFPTDIHWTVDEHVRGRVSVLPLCGLYTCEI